MSSDTPPAAAPRLQTAALLVIRVVGLWILAGAIAKLFVGSPNLLPPVVKRLPLGIELTYKLVIVVELALAWLAFLKPRWAWPLLAATLVVFDALLGGMIASGEAKCGCFGSNSPPPAVMLAIDTVMLVALLGTMPWRSIRKPGAHPLVPLALTAVTGVAAWLWIDHVTAVPDAPPAASPAGTGSPTNGPVDGTASDPASGAGAAATAPRAMPRFVTLEPKDWTDQMLADTPLARWIPAAELPTEGRVAFYRQTCEHCAEHLEVLAAEDVGMPIALIRVVEDHDTAENELTRVKPSGPHVTMIELPTGTEWVVDTPWDLELAGGVVIASFSGHEEH